LDPIMRLAFDPPATGEEELRATGPWALFRLFGRAHMQAEAGSPDRYTLTFQVGARRVVFELRVPGGGNPLSVGMLQEFRCPIVRAN
jgi:type VI secretion system protein ImpL